MENENDPTTGGVRVIKASEFKAKCLQLMDEVAASGEEIIITKRGCPTQIAPSSIAASFATS